MEKKILCDLAFIDDVKAYRRIEKFIESASGTLKQWATLSLQESRMLLQSSLLDEQQVFISTGLGGKGKKLRYFVVFLSVNENEMLSSTQQKLLKDDPGLRHGVYVYNGILTNSRIGNYFGIPSKDIDLLMAAF